MEDEREAAVAEPEAAAASRVRALQEELDSAKDVHRDAKRVHKDAAARCNEASQKVMASEGVDGSPDKVEAVSPRKRGRTGSGAQEPTIQGLPDACKASLEYRRAAAKAAMQILALSPVCPLSRKLRCVTATMRRALALILFAHCDRAWSALQPLRPPSADGFRIAYFGYGSNLAASVREGRRGLRPLSCEVRSRPTCLP